MVESSHAGCGADSFMDRLVCGDNLAWMAGLPDEICNLVYVDPPFMTNTVRTDATGRRFDDRWAGGIDCYIGYLTPRLAQIRRLLRESATLYVHVDPRTSHYVKVALDGLFGATNFLNEIIWSYRTGGRSTRWFARKHDTILVYAKRIGHHTFHLQRNGRFRTDGLKYDETGRPYKSTRKGRLYFHPGGPALTDVWEMPFLSTVARERTGYPSQKPESLLERIISASSDPGDLVADVFCGSGTTLAVAKRMARHWMGCDVSPEAVAITTKRLAGVDPRANRSRELPVSTRRRI